MDGTVADLMQEHRWTTPTALQHRCEVMTALERLRWDRALTQGTYGQIAGLRMLRHRMQSGEGKVKIQRSRG